MCTLTYLPCHNGHIVTSNRDVEICRPSTSLLCHTINNKKIYFPEDIQSKGTWIIVNEQGDWGVLLNGAFNKHTSLHSYKESRGLLLPFLFNQPYPHKALEAYQLNGIENFTIILYIENNMFQYTWDGQVLHCEKKDSQQPAIWSSATLYDDTMKKIREEWFHHFLEKQPIDAYHILQFHQTKNQTCKHYAIQMDRFESTQKGTLSTTQIIRQSNRLYTHYFNYLPTREEQHLEWCVPSQSSLINVVL